MAATAVEIGYGADFGISNDRTISGVFADLAELVNVDGIGLTREIHDATHMKSLNKFRENIEGLMSADNITLTINYIPAANDVIRTEMEGGKGAYRIAFNDANSTTLTFVGIIENYSISNPLDDKRTATIVIKPSGQGVWA